MSSMFPGTISCQNFTAVDLDGAQISDVVFDGCVFICASLNDVSFGLMANCNLSSAQMNRSTFSNMANCNLSSAMLYMAQFPGMYTNVSFQNADLEGAILGGVFSRVNFSYAIFDGADLGGATLGHCSFHGAHGLTEEMLRQAAALRGSILPDGTLYDGRWELPGDLQNALQAGYDLDDPEQRGVFYSRRKLVAKLAAK